jgi:hypothetical protein
MSNQFERKLFSIENLTELHPLQTQGNKWTRLSVPDSTKNVILDFVEKYI